jgi:hypothetical protein
MNLLNFIEQYPDEAACIERFKAERDQNGVVCHRRGSHEHLWLKNKLSYECKHCHSRQSLRSGTVMEHSKLSFRYWFVAMHLLTATKKSFSSSELQRQLGSQYFAVFSIFQRTLLHYLFNVKRHKYKDKILVENRFSSPQQHTVGTQHLTFRTYGTKEREKISYFYQYIVPNGTKK